MGVKLWLTLAMKALFFVALLFGAAGTIRWPAGWAYITIFFVAGSLDHALARVARPRAARRAHEIAISKRPAVLGQNFYSAHDASLVRLDGSDGPGCRPLPLVRHAGLAAMRRGSAARFIVLDDRALVGRTHFWRRSSESKPNVGTE